MKEQTMAVQRMQEYIEAHLTEKITPNNLAEASLYSPWHSYRLFQDYLGMSPAEYIRRLRLTKSVMKLKTEEIKVIDVAAEMGFSSVDGFQRAFYREFGYNPKEYANTKVPLPLFVPYGVKFRELRKGGFDMKEAQNVFVQLMRKPRRKVIIKRGIKADDYFEYCSEVGCDVWGTLLSMDSLCGEPVCLWLPEQYQKQGTSIYVQGVETLPEDEVMIPEGFDVIELPEAEYLVFQGEPFKEEDYCGAIQALQYSMDRYDPTLIGYVWDDDNPRIQLEPRGVRGYIELRAVKRRQ